MVSILIGTQHFLAHISGKESLLSQSSAWLIVKGWVTNCSIISSYRFYKLLLAGELLGINEASRALGVSPQTLRKWDHEDMLNHRDYRRRT